VVFERIECGKIAIGGRTRDLRRTRSLAGNLDLAVYSAKMTPQQEKNILKEGEFDGHVA
jgi:hypothetical protein